MVRVVGAAYSLFRLDCKTIESLDVKRLNQANLKMLINAVSKRNESVNSFIDGLMSGHLRATCLFQSRGLRHVQGIQSIQTQQFIPGIIEILQAGLRDANPSKCY